MSRHGIEVSERDVKDKIFHGISLKTNEEYNDEEKDDTNIDIVEIVTLLIIPHLLKLSGNMLSNKMHLLDAKDKAELQFPKKHDHYMKNLKIMREKDPFEFKLASDTLELILGGITPSKTSPRKAPILNAQFVKNILIKYGEAYVCNDDDLIDRMIKAATDPNNENDEIVLDDQAFMRALTSDIELYDLHNDISYSSFYHDVFHMDKCTAGLIIGDEENVTLNDIKIKFTANSIDDQADNFRDKTYNALLWINWIAIYLVYFANPTHAWHRCSVNEPRYFGCLYGKWMAYYAMQFILFSVVGTLFICLASFGNSSASVNKKFGLGVSLMTIILFSIITFFVNIDTYHFSTIKNWNNPMKSFGYILSFMLGWVLIVMRVRLALGSNDATTAGETCLKEAATYKINKMIHDAHMLQSNISALSKSVHASDATFLEYEKHRHNNKRIVGGMRWTVENLYHGHIFREEGIWISSRIISCFCALLYVVVACGLICSMIIDSILPIEPTIMAPVDKSGVVDVSGVPLHTLLIRNERAFKGCAVTATIIAVLNAFFLAAVIIPSYIGQTLKLRYGLKPSLRDDSGFFFKLRHKIEYICVLFPSSVRKKFPSY